jgi:tetratricopeptide (TPR) repeat protein
MKIILTIITCLLSLTGYSQSEIELNTLQRFGKLNLVPMYGHPNIVKTPDYVKADESFITTISKDYQSKNEASKELVYLGLNFFYKGELQTAMKRFNQAWLVDSTNAGSYFGFWLVQTAIETPSIRNDYFASKVIVIETIYPANRFYKIGQRLDHNNKNEKDALDYACSSFINYLAGDKGLESCNKKLIYNPTDTLAMQNLANTYIEMGAFEKGLKIQLKSLTYRKNSAFVFNDIAWSYEQLNKPDSAFFYYLKSIKNSKNTYFKPRLNYCILKEKTGNCENTIPIINECIQELPKEGFFYLIKGRLQICLNQKIEAKETLKLAKKLGNKEAKQLLKKI